MEKEIKEMADFEALEKQAMALAPDSNIFVYKYQNAVLYEKEINQQAIKDFAKYLMDRLPDLVKDFLEGGNDGGSKVDKVND